LEGGKNTMGEVVETFEGKKEFGCLEDEVDVRVGE
jgi:hypothetical protein